MPVEYKIQRRKALHPSSHALCCVVLTLLSFSPPHQIFPQGVPAVVRTAAQETDVSCGLFKMTKYALAGFILIGTGLVFLLLFILAYCFCCRRTSGSSTPPHKSEEGEITIVCTRIYGEAWIWAQEPVEMRKAMEEYAKIVRKLITKYKFYEVSYYSGRFTIAADDPVQATIMSVDLQETLFQHFWGTALDEVYKAAERQEEAVTRGIVHPPTARLPAPKYIAQWNGLRVNVGISSGPAYARRSWGGSFFFMGAPTALAETLAEIGKNGQVLLSEEAYRAVTKNVMAHDKSTEDRVILKRYVRLCTATLYNNADVSAIYQMTTIEGRHYGGIHFHEEPAEAVILKKKRRQQQIQRVKLGVISSDSSDSSDYSDSSLSSERESSDESSQSDESAILRKKERKAERKRLKEEQKREEKQRKKEEKERKKEEKRLKREEKQRLKMEKKKERSEKRSTSRSRSFGRVSSSGSSDSTRSSEIVAIGRPRPDLPRRPLSRASSSFGSYRNSIYSRMSRSRRSSSPYGSPQSNRNRRRSSNHRSSYYNDDGARSGRGRLSSRYQSKRNSLPSGTLGGRWNAASRHESRAKHSPNRLNYSNPALSTSGLDLEFPEDDFFQMTNRRAPNLYAIDSERSKKLSQLASRAGAGSPSSPI